MSEVVLPKSWISVRLGDILEFKYGKSLPAKNRDGTGYPVFGSNGIVGKHSEPLVQSEGLIIGRKGSHGEVHYSVTPFSPIDTTYFVDQFYSLPIKYWFYQLKNLPLTQLNRATAIPGLNRNDAYNQIIGLPPLAEQKEIAVRLDDLLGQVDDIKRRLDGIPAILKRFREATLSAAVSGRLTEDWRKENGVSVQEWVKTTFSNICQEITVGFVGKMVDKYRKSGIPFFRSQNIKPFKLSFENVLYIEEDFHKQISKSRLYVGDLAIVRTGVPGTTCVIPEEIDEANCSDLVIARPGKNLNSDFGCIFMNSEIAQKNVINNQVGIAQQHFNVGAMKKMPIFLPVFKEQKEIVHRVNEFLALSDHIDKHLKKAWKNVDNLRQAILSKAFTGELTVDWRKANLKLTRGKKSASILLQQIKHEKEKSLLEQKKKKRKTIRKVVPKKEGENMNTLLEVLEDQKDWVSAQKAFILAGIVDGSDTDTIEPLYEELRKNLDKITIERRGDEDWMRLISNGKGE